MTIGIELKDYLDNSGAYNVYTSTNTPQNNVATFIDLLLSNVDKFRESCTIPYTSETLLNDCNTITDTGGSDILYHKMLQQGVTNGDMHVLYQSTPRNVETDGELRIMASTIPISGTTFAAVDYTDNLTIDKSWAHSKSTVNVSTVTIDKQVVRSPHGLHEYFHTGDPDPQTVVGMAVVNSIGYMFNSGYTTCLANDGRLFVVVDSDADTQKSKPLWSNEMNDIRSNTSTAGGIAKHTKFDKTVTTNQYLVSRNGLYIAVMTDVDLKVYINTYNSVAFGSWTQQPATRASSAMTGMVSYCHTNLTDKDDSISFADDKCFCLSDQAVMDASFHLDDMTPIEQARVKASLPCMTQRCVDVTDETRMDTLTNTNVAKTCARPVSIETNVCSTIVTVKGHSTIKSLVIESCGDGDAIECQGAAGECPIASSCNLDLRQCKLDCETDADCMTAPGTLCSFNHCLTANEISALDSGMSTGTIVGIVVAGVVVVAIAVSLGVVYGRRHRQRKKQ
jgi:hypothetical protein